MRKYHHNYEVSEQGFDFSGYPLTVENTKGWIMVGGKVIENYVFETNSNGEDQVVWKGISGKQTMPLRYVRLAQAKAHETIMFGVSQSNPDRLVYESTNAPIYGDARTIEDIKRKAEAMWGIWLSEMLSMKNDIRYEWNGKGGCLHSLFKKDDIVGISCNCEKCMPRC